MSCERAGHTDLDAVLENVSAPETLVFLAHCRECSDCAGALIARQDALASASAPAPGRRRRRKPANAPEHVPEPAEEPMGAEASPATGRAAPPAALWIAAGVAGLALLAGGTAWWLASRGDPSPAETPPPATAAAPSPGEAPAPDLAAARPAPAAPRVPVPGASPSAARPDAMARVAPAPVPAPPTAAARESKSGKAPRDGFKPAVILDDYAVELLPRVRHSLSLDDLPGNSPVELSLTLRRPLEKPSPVEVMVIASQREPFEAIGTVAPDHPDRVRVQVDRAFLESGTYVVSAKVQGRRQPRRYVLEVR